MNKNIEDIIKEALENHDSGYVTGAWEKMSARLDGTTPTPFYKKWWVAAAFGTVLVGSAAYFLISENNSITEAKKSSDISVNQSQQVENHLSTKPNETTSSNQTGTNNIVSNDINGIIQSSSNGATNSSAGNTSTTPNDAQTTGHSNSNGNPSPSDNGTQGPADIDVSQETFKKVVLPSDICLNDQVVIGNPNNTRFITVVDANGKSVDLAPGKKMSITAKTAGVITVISGEHRDVVNIRENNTKLYIDYDASLLYENGIPTLKFKVPGNKEDLTWESNVKSSETKGETFIVHPYTQRFVDVTATSTNEFGCAVTETQRIDVDDYNLLAPTGFRPNSGDRQTNTFMPYALTQRSVNFELVIIDPRNGGVLFSTTDANQGWDGIDKRTGEMVNDNSVWAWKVVLKNPNIGEPSEYKGSITKM